jgi:hypothetical protein
MTRFGGRVYDHLLESWPRPQAAFIWEGSDNFFDLVRARWESKEALAPGR